MGLLSGIALIIIVFGLVSLTYIVTKQYYMKKDINNNVIEEKEKMYRDRPSKVFNNMFRQPDIWMGYADIDTKGKFNGKLI
jgi:hypothetical protein